MLQEAPPAEHLWLLTPLGVLLLWTIRIVHPRLSTVPRSFWDTVVTLGSATLVLLGIGHLGPMAFGFALILAGMAYHRYRVTESQGLVGYLAHAMEQHVPLPAAATAYAHEQSADMRRRGLMLADLLRDGWPLGTAIERVGLTMPAHTRMAAAISDRDPRMHDLVPLAARQRRLVAAVWLLNAERFAYLFGLLLVLAVLQVFMAVKMAPAYATMWDDFSLPPSAAMHRLRAFAQNVRPESDLLPALLLMLMFGSLLLLVLGPLAWIAYYTGWVTWRPTIVQQWFFPLDLSFVYSIMSVAHRKNVPVDVALREIALAHAGSLMRTRVNNALARIQSGADWISALRRAKLLRPIDASMLRAAQKAGNLAWMWQDLATAVYRRWTHRVQAILQIVYPSLIIACGVVVGITAVMWIEPLVKIVESLL